MKKIMFNDRYGLTQAVLNGTKTVTRRTIKNQTGNLAGHIKYTKKDSELVYVRADFDNGISANCPYAIGEIVAVAQCYYSVMMSGVQVPYKFDINLTEHKGWINKMFVQADLMPHQVRILDVRAERLQDITDEDCLREYPDCDIIRERHVNKAVSMGASVVDNWMSRRDVFAWLIDKISGKGTWERNPFVWRIEFEYINE